MFFTRKVNNGMTMIELIIVCAILMMLTVFSIRPMLESTLMLKSEAAKLCSHIREVRIKNMTDTDIHTVLLTSEGYKVLIGTKEIYHMDFKSRYQILDSFPDKNAFYTELRFNNNGGPNYAGTIRLIHRKSGKYRVITVMPASGRVLLYDQVYDSK